MQTKHLRSQFKVKNLQESGVFEGYGSVFDVVDQQRDVVAKGAFQRSLKEWRRKGAMPKLLWQHDPAHPIGVFDEIFEDAQGLRVKGRLLLDVQKAQEAYSLLKAKALDGLSIGYCTRQAHNDHDRNVRVLTDVDLHEVSLVTFAANEQARVASVKNNLHGIRTIREFEAFLRDVGGFSRAQAKLIASQGFMALDRRDDVSEPDDLTDILTELQAVTDMLLAE